MNRYRRLQPKTLDLRPPNECIKNLLTGKCHRGKPESIVCLMQFARLWIWMQMRKQMQMMLVEAQPRTKVFVQQSKPKVAGQGGVAERPRLGARQWLVWVTLDDDNLHVKSIRSMLSASHPSILAPQELRLLPVSSHLRVFLVSYFFFFVFFFFFSCTLLCVLRPRVSSLLFFFFCWLVKRN